MKIIYVANFDQTNSNQDEEAIQHAFALLGHQVTSLREFKGRKAKNLLPADMILFHKWHDVASLDAFAGKAVRVFWYFDLVDWPDPTLRQRCDNRLAWMRDIVPHVEVGFCTDGDWVDKDATGKLVHLMQGADGRIAGYGTAAGKDVPILYTGNKHGGTARATHIAHLTAIHGRSFRHVQGVYGRALANTIAQSQVVVAPDSPVTDRYYSNRVYLTLGFGGFLLHPHSELLATHYTDGKELVTYRSRGELDEKIRYYLGKPDECKRIADAGLKRTLAEHTYLHRCRELIRVVRERTGAT